MTRTLISDPEKCLQNYLELEELLNRFFKQVNFCGPNCLSQEKSLYPDRLNGSLGCCTYDSWNSGIDPYEEKMLFRLHKERIKIYGKPNHKSRNKCFYHTDQGCKLKTHRAPVCIGYICDPFTKYLKENFGLNIYRDHLERPLENTLTDKLSEREFQKTKDLINSWIERIRNGKN